MASLQAKETVRCGVFETVEQAHRAVRGLLNAGFHTGEITVVCSDDEKERHFRQFEHEDPAGAHAPERAAVGGAIGATAGGLMTAGLATAAGLSILVAGPGLLIAGGVLGGLIGAMTTRADEKGLADFYDQALTDGKILVGVEVKDPQRVDRLAKAESVFHQAGTEPLPIDAQA